MSWSEQGLALAILAMALITYATRALPFLLGRDNRLLAWLANPDGPLATLGPAIIAALAAVTILPEARTALASDRWPIFLAATAATLIALRLLKEPGLAVLIGLATYWLGLLAIA